jgi:hypothetical protein
MLSFSSYFLLKKPLKIDLPFVEVITSLSTVCVLEASDTGFVTVFAAVFGLVDLDFVVFDADALGFFVAISPP